MDPNGNGKRGLPLLREIIRRQRQDSDDQIGAGILNNWDLIFNQSSVDVIQVCFWFLLLMVFNCMHFINTKMNPFNLTTDNKHKFKKNESPLTVASSITSSNTLMTGGTRVRKPFYQIYLEEIARKSKIASRREKTAKGVGYCRSRHIFKMAKQYKESAFTPHESSSFDNSENSNLHEHSITTNITETDIPKVTELEQDLNLGNLPKKSPESPAPSNIFEPLEIPPFKKDSIKPLVQSQLKPCKKNNNTEVAPLTCEDIQSVFIDVPEDVRERYKKLGAIPKSFGKKCIPDASKSESLSVPTLSGSKTPIYEETAKNVPSLPSKDIEKKKQIINFWKPTRNVKSVKISRLPKEQTSKKLFTDEEPTIIAPSSEIAITKSLKTTVKTSRKPEELEKNIQLKPLINEMDQLKDLCDSVDVEPKVENSPEASGSDREKQSGEKSSPENNPTIAKSYSEICLTSSNSEEELLGDFYHDLGEAILDSIFFGQHNYEDVEYEDDEEENNTDFNDPKIENKDTLQTKDTSHLQISPILQCKRFSGQGGGADSPDLEFVYDDTDTHGNEIAELYSYTEQPELQLNVKAFEDQMESYNLPPSWQRLPVEKRKSVIMKLLDQLEVSKKPLRMRSARCILYIAQGCWAEMQSDTEQQHWARINCMLLYQLGAFSAFTDLLNIEIENSTAAHVAMRKIAVSLADSQDLRVILSVLYTITEVIRNERATDNSEYKNDIEAFCFEIGNASGDELLVIKLLGMVTRFCSGAAPHFPMKKVLLLLWKLILVSLGGMTTLKELKAEKRRRAGLPPQDEDTMEIAKTMRSSSPPASASDLLEAQNQKRNTRPFRRSLMKQSSLDDQESLGMEMETTMGSDNGDDLADMTEYDERRPSDNSEASQMYNNHNINMYNRQMSPPPQHDVLPRGLPWKPKVRQKDIDMFLDGARQKFLGYSLPGDQTTLFGLPEPIHEGVKILKEHVYISLAELQIQKEEEIARNPLSTEEDEIDLTPAEMLYQAMLPNLPQYMIALLKILLAAAPTSKAKTDSINIMADVLPEEMPMTVLQSMKLGIDVNRHKEIIVKAVSAVLLLLLKHFKLNHIYQFEFMSQHLVFANCIPLVLKFFNQNIMAYVGAKNVIPILDFPSCVIGDQPELTAESLEIGDAASFSWRNMFSCINLLRILNKLTKWKHSRIMMLVVFKSAPILKRTLKVRHAMTQLYVLKLLKMQTKYLGRQWRKSNMKTISAIYQKVRHRLNDDWAYGNDLDARPWDFQAEECALRASVDRFNNRRYTLVNESEFEPVDNCLSSVLGANHELSENFKTHYSLWLEQEVFGTPIEWEKLLLNDNNL